ncbi:hypothetical protein [Singulisphaera sp. PoT]|uniref:hypothetical protein n=1 Tax=Singulisphaera sp. PoT TaxID=3411797 RepID=UPI003BF60CEF
MGVLKFRLTSPMPATRAAELRKAYVTGLDRTPSRLSTEVRNGILTCHRDSNESGRLFVPWAIDGFGAPIVGTATLAERVDAYNLAVELARGKLNEVRNQLADWQQMGLRVPQELSALLAKAHRSFVKAATSGTDLAASYVAAQSCLATVWEAGNLLVDTYTSQVLHTRLAGSAKLPTWLGGVLDGDPKQAPWASELAGTFSSAQARCTWKSLAPTEGQFRWDEFDAQLAWCRKQRLAPQAGPLLEFHASAVPDWIWLWEGDFDTILGLVVDLVRQTVSRYRGKVPVWHLVHRPASTEFLGLSEEEQIRLTARAVQVARQADPSAQFTIGVERPWAEWMGSSPFQLGPLHLADYLVRADIGVAGIMLEIAPGYSSPGSHIRDLFDFSKLLDLYALLNLPLYITMAIPSASTPDPKADPTVRVETSQWPTPPDEATQAHWASKWVALAVAKPFVRSVTWAQASDNPPHLFPHAGLFRTNHTPKPVVSWLKSFRRELIA